jgi:GH15 family glucan-1,4-alpha-glucosidase
MIPLVHFLPATDPRMRGTVEAIKKELLVDGFVMRYPTQKTDDGLPPGEGSFLACTFWLIDNLALSGSSRKATEMFERMLLLRNDVGLLSEEIRHASQAAGGQLPAGVHARRLVNSAYNLDGRESPARGRSAPPRFARRRAFWSRRLFQWRRL